MNASNSPFRYIRELDGWRGHVRLYKDTRDDTYVAVSRAHTPDHGDETMAFPVTSKGDVTSWSELAAGHGVTHEELLRDMI